MKVTPVLLLCWGKKTSKDDSDPDCDTDPEGKTRNDETEHGVQHRMPNAYKNSSDIAIATPTPRGKRER